VTPRNIGVNLRDDSFDDIESYSTTLTDLNEIIFI